MIVTESVVAVGVYRWPHSSADVESACQMLFGTRTPETLRRTRDQFEKLVVVELEIKGDRSAFDIGRLTQCAPEDRDGNEQVPYDESWWSADGERLAGLDSTLRAHCRVIFFLHEFEPDQPLWFGDDRAIVLPPITPMPERWRRHLRYEPP